MSVSQAQVVANRQNAQLSTGPRTESGKATSSRNATKHGLFCRDLFLKSPHLTENPEEYEEILDSLRAELRPDGAFQDLLVQKIATCFWLNRRSLTAETAHTNGELDEVEDDLQDMDYYATDDSDDEDDDEDDDKDDDAPDTKDDNTPLPSEDPQVRFNVIGKKLLPQGDFAQDLLRYERRLEQQMERAFKMFQQARKLTRGTRPAALTPADTLENGKTNPINCCGATM